ncbi:MAG: universal stress protein [Candidatus Cyclobacteriaceae bacterium M3_2C_046]
MAYYKRILVCFDLSDTDEVLAQHVSNYCNENQVDKVYFLNVTNTLEIPDEIAEKYPDLLVPVDESIKKSMAYTIEKYFPERSSYEIDVAEGSRAEKILKWSKVKDTDLIVMGLKADRQGVDVLIRKIAKLAHSTLSLIPDQVPEKLNRILIPMDFSGHSKMALEEAIGLKTKNPWVEIRGLHIYTVPSGYHKTGKSYEEFAEIMKQNALK